MTEIKWHNDNGNLIACIEKIKVMQENLTEISSMIQDIIDDGVLMDISESQIKEAIKSIIDNISFSYKDN
jgi:DNA-binding transcriptional regulator YhcF (GntR family)